MRRLMRVQQILIETVVMSEFSTGHHSPIPPAGKSGLRANALPSFCLSPRQFFKACFHQEPDPTNSLLTRCGYGAVRFKKNKTRSMAGFVKMGDG